MLKFLCFGSGSSGNCYYLSNGQEAIIIDAGVGIRAIKKNFLKYGINPAKIKAILVTHDHMDHVRAVNPLSKLLNVKVYSSEKVIRKLIRSRLTQIDPSASQPVEAGVTFMIGNLAITPFQLPHDAADNYGYAGLRRQGYQQVDVVPVCFAGYQFPAIPGAEPPCRLHHEITCCIGDGRFSPFRHEHEMVCQQIHCMPCVDIFFTHRVPPSRTNVRRCLRYYKYYVIIKT